jgi:hypothetical protein
MKNEKNLKKPDLKEFMKHQLSLIIIYQIEIDLYIEKIWEANSLR